MYYEGTKDFVVMTPCLLVTFKASGSITAGKLVCFDAGGTSDVYQATVAIGGAKAVGLAVQTVSDDDPVNVMVWGFAKNLALTYASETIAPGEAITISGSGGFTSGSARSVGRVVSGSAARFMAFIDCMKNET